MDGCGVALAGSFEPGAEVETLVLAVGGGRQAPATVAVRIVAVANHAARVCDRDMPRRYQQKSDVVRGPDRPDVDGTIDPRNLCRGGSQART